MTEEEAKTKKRGPLHGLQTKADFKKQQRKKNQEKLGVCRIRRNRGGECFQTLGCGVLVKELNISGRSYKHCLITSENVFPEDSEIKNYYLDFLKLKSDVLKTIKLEHITKSTEVHRTSGLAVIRIKPSKNCDNKDSIFDYRQFASVSERVKPDHDDLRCHYVDDFNSKLFAVKWLELKPSTQGQHELHEVHESPYKTYAEVTRRGDRKPYGAAILKHGGEEFEAAGILTFSDDESRSVRPVFFPIETSLETQDGATQSQSVASEHAIQNTKSLPNGKKPPVTAPTAASVTIPVNKAAANLSAVGNDSGGIGRLSHQNSNNSQKTETHDGAAPSQSVASEHAIQNTKYLPNGNKPPVTAPTAASVTIPVGKAAANLSAVGNDSCGIGRLSQQNSNALQNSGPITITEEPPSLLKAKEGSNVELVVKCKARGNSKLFYQWFKDDTELQGENESVLLRKSVTLPDFGCYKCRVSCKDRPSDNVESSPADLDVTPRDGTKYKCLSDINDDIEDKIGKLLTQKKHSLGGWRQIAFKYGMNKVNIESLRDDPEAGIKTLDYLHSSNPYLTVYDFCKTLKENNIRRLDIVKELLRDLSVPCS